MAGRLGDDDGCWRGCGDGDITDRGDWLGISDPAGWGGVFCGDINRCCNDCLLAKCC